MSLSAVLQCFLLTFSDQPMSYIREVMKFHTALSSKRAFPCKTRDVALQDLRKRHGSGIIGRQAGLFKARA